MKWAWREIYTPLYYFFSFFSLVLSLFLSLYLSLSLSPSFFLSLSFSVFLSLSLLIILCIYLSIYPSIPSFASLSLSHKLISSTVISSSRRYRHQLETLPLLTQCKYVRKVLVTYRNWVSRNNVTSWWRCILHQILFF